MRRNKLILVLVIGVTTVFVVGWQVRNYLQHKGKIAISVVILPPDSRFTIDGAQVKPGKLYVQPGTHKLAASRQDFDDVTETINTADIPSGQTIYLLPGASSDAAKAYLMQHPDIQRQREAAGSIEAERARTELLKKYPVINSLPHQTQDYKIDYSIDSNQKLSLTITTYAIINGPSDYSNYVRQTHSFRQEALDYLKKKGIESTAYPVTYVPSF